MQKIFQIIVLTGILSNIFFVGQASSLQRLTKSIVCAKNSKHLQQRSFVPFFSSDMDKYPASEDLRIMDQEMNDIFTQQLQNKNLSEKDLFDSDKKILKKALLVAQNLRYDVSQNQLSKADCINDHNMWFSPVSMNYLKKGLFFSSQTIHASKSWQKLYASTQDKRKKDTCLVTQRDIIYNDKGTRNFGYIALNQQGLQADIDILETTIKELKDLETEIDSQ